MPTVPPEPGERGDVPVAETVRSRDQVEAMLCQRPGRLEMRDAQGVRQEITVDPELVLDASFTFSGPVLQRCQGFAPTQYLSQGLDTA